MSWGGGPRARYSNGAVRRRLMASPTKRSEQCRAWARSRARPRRARALAGGGRFRFHGERPLLGKGVAVRAFGARLGAGHSGRPPVDQSVSGLERDQKSQARHAVGLDSGGRLRPGARAALPPFRPSLEKADHRWLFSAWRAPVEELRIVLAERSALPDSIGAARPNDVRARTAPAPSNPLQTNCEFPLHDWTHHVRGRHRDWIPEVGEWGRARAHPRSWQPGASFPEPSTGLRVRRHGPMTRGDLIRLSSEAFTAARNLSVITLPPHMRKANQRWPLQRSAP